MLACFCYVSFVHHQPGLALCHPIMIADVLSICWAGGTAAAGQALATRAAAQKFPQFLEGSSRLLLYHKLAHKPLSHFLGNSTFMDLRRILRHILRSYLSLSTETVILVYSEADALAHE